MAVPPSALTRLDRADLDFAWGTRWAPEELDFSLAPSLPADRSRGIAVVGAGFVVNLGHLPAYRQGGLRVTGIYDIVPERAQQTAREYGLPRTYHSLDELLADSDASVVDVALPPVETFSVVRQALLAGKHVLVQKPMAMTLSEAHDLVALARKRSRKLAVMQNARWDGAVRTAHLLIERGLLGQPVMGSIEMRFRMRWASYLNDPAYGQLMVLQQSIHHLDDFRFWFGEPDRVFCTVSRYPDQVQPGEGLAVITLMYTSGLVCTLIDDGFSWGDDDSDQFRLEGTDGIIKGSVGWGRRTTSTLSFTTRHFPRYWFSPTLAAKWYPDSFLGPMADLLCAIEEDRPPATSGEDNLNTLRVVFAAYRSAQEGRSVALVEV